jgi:glycosyltransferase involved in cell wall biosynthesis
MDSKVSILIPAYNRRDFIVDAIKSCVVQSYDNIEIIVYDDGSTDDTVGVIKRFLKNTSVENKNKIKLIEGKENHGVGFARNVLLDSIEGKYACWLDSDDLVPIDRIKTCIDFMENNPETDIVYSNIQWFHTVGKHIGYGNIIRPDVSRYSKNEFSSLSHNSTCATAFFKSDLKEFRFLEGLNLGGEDSLWLWELIKSDKIIKQIDKVLYYYRSHNDRIGVIKRKEEFRELKDKEGLIIYKHLNKDNTNESDK